MEYKIEDMDEKSIELPIFGKITLRESDWEYQYQYNLAEYDFNGSPVDLDVNFMELTDDHMEKVSQALKDLKRLNGIGMKGFKQDFEDGGETRSYIEEWSDILRHLFTEEEFETYIRDTDNQKSIEERLLSRLRLVRAGIYAGSQNYFMIMDYAFGYDIEKGFRDDILVVKLDRDYNIVDISNEG